uniref:ER membrane protein complex subunit 8/9 homolog n=1 Tax=Phallusia mammillata TaxID=59560 RepID=A0A6F9DCH3_9ASCI|nr:ER membrane protein complex subunit 8/9 homolog [Phallusia mammillata]
MSLKSIEISCQAFTKLQLHLAKYPHCSVNGLMLACQKKLASEKIVHIVDIIPMFHQCLQLSPMLEIALMHVDSHCDMNNLCIAGYYEAQENLKASTDPTPFSIRVADKIFANCAEAKLVMIDNTQVPTKQSLVLYEKNPDGKWKKCKTDVKLEENCDEILQPLMDRRIYRDLVDFDNHLDDISQHWLNQPINKLIVMS